MRINHADIRLQIDELLTVYTDLKECSSTHNKEIIISGNISINRIYKNFVVDKEYEIKICIPLKNDEMPVVWDIGDSINKSYVHKYSDGTLCLETDAYVAYCFYNGYSLLQWMKNIVEPYYYSYEYYSRFGEFPFGERGHGIIGVVETYQQLFNEQDLLKVCRLLSYVSHRKYRGHLLCPCGSGIITRKCHGKNIFPFICDNQLNDIAFRDYEKICKEIRKYDK